MDPSSSSPSSSAATPESRREAGPLPRKRGEIGYEYQEHTPEDDQSTAPTTELPARHPEDRGATDIAADSTPPTAPAIPAATTSSSSLPTSTTKPKRILGIFKPPKDVPAYWGLRLTTLLACVVQIMFVAGTVVGWYFAITKLGKISAASGNTPQDQNNPPDNGGNNNNGSSPVLGGASSAIFIHVVFGVGTIVQLLFIERRIFKLRAQRYSYVHPGEILPSARHRQQMGDPSLALSPWNRPPLPTYAAALAQSGAGTGDVEDHLIAAPPPPAYGNTRGSTFLLSGFLPENLRSQRPVSVQSNASGMRQQPQSRPLSYKSVDEDWLEIQDADRARQLEETLSRLEAPAPAVTRP
ncbi:hypothetical protein MKEN_00343700 [Mycena kentingensis (nom. inval.)]|nr:hypothetical protein MKEN_00343700 [Mycena kentingensis (nom. inval.)]